MVLIEELGDRDEGFQDWLERWLRNTKTRVWSRAEDVYPLEMAWIMWIWKVIQVAQALRSGTEK